MAEQNPYESPQSAPGPSRIPLVILASGACLLFVLFVLWARGFPKSWVFDYDTAAHADITRKIAADPQHLGGRRLDAVSRELGLEDIPWDELVTQIACGSCRMYHFRGFALTVYLEYRFEAITSDMLKDRDSLEEKLRAPELLRIDSYHRPFVTIDGISSREERMRRYQAMIDEQIEEINKEMDSNRQRRRNP